MKAFLDYASSMYYKGSPILSDDEFDRLADAHGYESVGAEVIGDRSPHAFPMWSLDKVYVGEDLPKFNSPLVESVKLDGAAVSLTYIYGRLVQALTRGDGKQGKVITDNMLELVPGYCSMLESIPLAQVTGEVVAPASIENSRNYASGALQLQSVEEFKTRELTFIAYGLQPAQHETWLEDIAMLSSDFLVVTQSDWPEFPNDGLVYRVNNYAEFEKLGYTAKHPRGAYALKTRAEGVVTTLLAVDWQVGKSGVISPVAILEPVVVGDANVSRATLHNYTHILALDLEIGCKVELIRSGEIIPRILGRVYD